MFARIASFPLLLFLCVCLGVSTAVAQDIFDEDPIVWNAKKINFVDIVCSSAEHQNEIGLTAKQKQEIEKIRATWTAESDAYSQKVVGNKPGEPVTGDVLTLAAKIRPEDRAHLRELERNVDARFRTLLTEEQVNVAEQLVLLERFRLGGIEAVLTSDDIAAASDLRFSRPKEEIKTELKLAERQAKQKIQKAIQQLPKEVRQNQDKYKREVVAIRLRELNAALDSLGNDGTKIKQLFARK